MAVAQAQMINPYEDAPEEELVQLCQRLLPGVPVRVKEGFIEADLIQPGRDNHGVIRELVASLRHHYPEAGRHYWSVRAWGLLIWQPVLLAVLASEVISKRLNLMCLGQRREGTMVAGMVLERGLLPAGNDSRDEAASHLRRVCDSVLDELGEVVRINPVLARRLLADRILATLLRIRPLLADDSPAYTCRLAVQWLKASGLEEASALMEIELPARNVGLALDRKGCCQHYRRTDGALCKTCPRQPMALRIKRLQEEWSLDAGAE